MGDCERGTLAVTTSEKISKNNYQLSNPTKNLVKKARSENTSRDIHKSPLKFEM